MIKGFENITKELTPHEMRFVEPLYEVFMSARGKKRAVRSTAIIKHWRVQGRNITDVQIRKVVNLFRKNKTIKGLCGSSRGYWIENNVEELKNYELSLNQRINEITEIRETVTSYINELESRVERPAQAQIWDGGD